MLKALSIFKENINKINEIHAIHNYLRDTIILPIDASDLLRLNYMYAVSAFDKLMHDVIRIGMVDIYSGKRAITSKFKSEPISFELHKQLINANIPPSDFLFNEFLVKKLSLLSFQAPDKISDGLSYVWNVPDKWKIIQAKLPAYPDAKTKMNLIVSRRNAIVHEADMNPISNAKNDITQNECADVATFLLQLGTEITTLVIENKSR